MLDSVPGSGMIYLEFFKLCKQTTATGSWYADWKSPISKKIMKLGTIENLSFWLMNAPQDNRTFSMFPLVKIEFLWPSLKYNTAAVEQHGYN